MARIVAVEWDASELRLAAGSRHGSTVSIDTLLASPLTSDSSGTSSESLDAIVVTALTKLVQQAGLSKSQAVFAAGRGGVEIRALSLPPADDSEIPDMVRFSAQRSFAQIGDSWPLDFVKLPSAEGGVQVLASAINPALMARFKKISDQSSLDLKRILIRPLASAALAIAKNPSLKSDAAIIVSVVGEEADLLVSQGGSVAIVRTSRLPQGDGGTREKAIVAEIKRTWMASESQTPSIRPTQLVVWGDLGIGANASISLAEKTGLPTTLVKLASSVELKVAPPDSRDVERFAPVVGLVHQVCQDDKQMIDFLAPRKREEKKKPYLMYGLCAAVAAVLVLGGFYLYYAKHNQLDQEIARLKKELKAQEPLVKVAEKKIEDWKKVEKFLCTDVQWLDQLVYLSEKALPADKMIVGGTPLFSISPTSGNASITAMVAAVEPQMLTEFEENLRDSNHRVQGKATTPAKDTKSRYRVVGSPTITMDPMSVAQLTELLKKPARPIPSDGSEQQDAKSVVEGKNLNSPATDPKVAPSENGKGASQ